MSHFILLNDGRKVEVQTVKEESGNLKIRMLLQTSEQLKAYFLDEFATKKIVEQDDGKESIYENYKLSYIKEETGGIWEVELLQSDAAPSEKLKMLEAATEKNATDLEQAIAELTMMIASANTTNGGIDNV